MDADTATQEMPRKAGLQLRQRDLKVSERSRTYDRFYDFHAKATSWGTKRALARKPRCRCDVCECHRYVAGHSLYQGHVQWTPNEVLGFDGHKLCWGCGQGRHTKRLVHDA